MRLYFLPGSCAMASHIVLNEIGVPAEFVKVDRESRTTPDGENYYSVSPNGYVPALKLDDGNVLLENAAILPYIGDLKPEAGWMPQSGLERYRALEWLGYANMELHGNYRPFFAGVDDAAKEIFGKRLITRYKLVDETLAKSPYLTGEHPIVADAYVYVVTRWAERVKLDLGAHHNVAAFQAAHGKPPRRAEDHQGAGPAGLTVLRSATTMSFHGVSYGPRSSPAPGALARLGDEVRALAAQGAGPSRRRFRPEAARHRRACGRGASRRGPLRRYLCRYRRRAEGGAGRGGAARSASLPSAKAVVCLGGGSALDAGKLAAAMLGTDAPVSAFRLAAEPLPEKSVPIVCVPTTAGTGSEMTGISVVSDAAKTKFWFWGAPLEADLALLDPELTVGPAADIHRDDRHGRAGPCDRGGDQSQCRAGKRRRRLSGDPPRRGKSSRQRSREPKNIEARGKMLEAAALGGLAIHKAGTALAHNIGHALGSLAPVPHGLAVTLAMAATAEWVVEGNREAFARVAEAMGEGADADAVPAAFRKLATDDRPRPRYAEGRCPGLDRRSARRRHGRAGKRRDAQVDQAPLRRRPAAAAEMTLRSGVSPEGTRRSHCRA